jgi:ADP-heptose:LPS heptosyltransferase
LPPLGLPPVLRAPLVFSPSPTAATESWLRNFCSHGERPILLFPMSRRVEKEWPHFQNLAVTLARKYADCPIVLLGDGEFSMADGEPNLHNLIGRTSIGDVIFLLGHGAVAVTNDSAPMHLAAAIGTPLVALFGPTDPGKFGPHPRDFPKKIPNGAGVEIVLRAEDGRMARITEAAVGAAVAEILRGTLPIHRLDFPQKFAGQKKDLTLHDYGGSDAIV